MPLRTAPCTRCRTLVVYGQRQCLQCGERFFYGATPPPEPTREQLEEVWAHARWQAQQAAAAQQVAAQQVAAQQALAFGGAPAAAGDEGEIDRGRFDDLSAADVEPEVIPGLIDSTLFAAYTPAEVPVERIEGLEATHFDDADARIPTDPGLELEQTSFGAVGEVAREEVPGLIDSTLFAAFTPAEVQTEAIEGLERSPSASVARPARGAARTRPDVAPPCADCGTAHARVVCPACGARRRDG